MSRKQSGKPVRATVYGAGGVGGSYDDASQVGGMEQITPVEWYPPTPQPYFERLTDGTVVIHALPEQLVVYGSGGTRVTPTIVSDGLDIGGVVIPFASPEEPS